MGPRLVRPLRDIGDRLFEVEKPARYLGGELGSIRGLEAPLSAESDEFVMALSFPDLYEIGMSNNAVRILYNGLNALPGLRCERVFAPAPDYEALLAELGLPLHTLESGIPLHEVDLLGFTLGYELAATSLLSVLTSGGIALRAAERGAADPIVIAGGPAISNPGTLSLFLDAAWIGEAEAGFYSLVGELRELKRGGADRARLLARIGEESAIWMPGREGREPKKALRAVYAGFSTTAYRTARPLPTVKVVQEHGTVEIMRGCPNGCRFCHAGYYYRPQRMKSLPLIREEVASLVREGGHREITLASLSSGDFEGLTDLVRELNAAWAGKGVSFQLPSLKVNSFTLPLIEALSELRKGGLTFAVETPEDAWQRVLNKDVSFERTLAILEEARARGFKLAKFYFMIGLPVPGRGMGEVESILGFFDRLAGHRLGMSFNVNVGTFVPKPHTPFQWCAQLGEEEAFAAIQSLRAGMRRHRNVKLSWHSPFISALEGVLSRGDERVGELILRAFERGARLDAWEDRFDRELWRSVLTDSGWDPFAEFLRERTLDEALPWDSIGIRVSTTWLKREYARALAGEMLSGCEENCTKPCGSCSEESGIVRNSIHPEASSPGVGEQAGPPMARLVLVYEKRGGASFLQHLQVVDAFSRAITMLDLPAAYSEGFNPLPRFELAPPLSMGVDSAGEIAVLLLRRPLGDEWGGRLLAPLVAAFNDRLPLGLRVLRAAQSGIVTGKKLRSIGHLSWGSRFLLRMRGAGSPTLDDLAEGLRTVLEREGLAGKLNPCPGEPEALLLDLPDSTRKGQGIQPVLIAALGGHLPAGASARSLLHLERIACLGKGEEGPRELFDCILAEGE